MNFLLGVMNFLLEQNAAEKRLTTISVIILVILFLYMVMDMIAKANFVPKNPVLRAVIIILFILTLGTLILIKIYYK